MEKFGDSQMRVAPLTHPDPQRPGNAYQRLASIEAQIAELLKLDVQIILTRANVLNFNAPDYIHSESLVYLIREALQNNDDNLVNDLTNALSRRCAKHINDRIQGLVDQRYIDDCFNDAVAMVFGPILDLSYDQGDFAQVRFGVFLKHGVSNVIRKYLKKQREDRITASLDTEIEDSEKAPPTPAALRVSEDSIHNRVTLNEVINTLSEPHRTAYLMRHIGGWEIGNKNPKVYTISKHFKRSTKTIQRWLAEAEEQLQLRWRERYE